MTRDRTPTLAAALAILMAGALPAGAAGPQDPGDAHKIVPVEPRDRAAKPAKPGQAAKPAKPGQDDATPPGEGSSAPSGATTRELSRSGGVIRPPGDPDPGIAAPTPNTGPQSTPVIPPPGTPGGDPTVTPK